MVQRGCRSIEAAGAAIERRKHIKYMLLRNTAWGSQPNTGHRCLPRREAAETGRVDLAAGAGAKSEHGARPGTCGWPLWGPQTHRAPLGPNQPQVNDANTRFISSGGGRDFTSEQDHDILPVIGAEWRRRDAGLVPALFYEPTGGFAAGAANHGLTPIVTYCLP